MTLRIQARRASAVSENELVYIGEMFYDDVNRRFGVFTNEDATTIRWLPRWVDDNLILNQYQKLTGMVSETEINNIVLDFTNQDSIKFQNEKTNEIYMELTPNGAVFLRANGEITEIAGSSNLAINGNLTITRNIGAEVSFTTGIDGNTCMFAPNWYVYSYPSSAGYLTASFETEDTEADDVAFERVLRISSSGNVTNCGVRSFFFDYKFVQNRFVTVTLRIKGQPGVTTTIKALSELDAHLASMEVTGTGEWELVSFPCYMPPSSSKWWAVDTLFEPGKNTSFINDWLVGGLQVNIGTTPGILERRAKNVEQSLVDTIYAEGRLLIGEDAVDYPVTLDSFVVTPNKVEILNPSDGNAVSSDMDTTGFNISVHDTSATNFIVKYAAYSAPSPTPDL